MFKKSLLVLMAVIGLASVTGCSLPSWLGGGSSDAKPAAKK